MSGKEVWKDEGEFVMCMRSRSWLMASSFHFAISNIRHDGFPECEKLESTSVE
jgi:hypothetical protein